MIIGNNSYFQDLGNLQSQTPYAPQTFSSEGTETFLSVYENQSTSELTSSDFGMPTSSQSDSLQQQLETLISGYDRAALEEVQAKEKEQSDWNALLDAVDRHIELTQEGMEKESQEKLEEWVEQEEWKRSLLWNMEQDSTAQSTAFSL